ncbi:MAG: DUF1501 domain-containing protein, partial [Spirosomataceae bacterium]
MGHHHNDEFKLHTPEFERINKKIDRRNFLTKTSLGLGAVALGSLFEANNLYGSEKQANTGALSDEEMQKQILAALPHIAPKAKRVVYLFMSGGPSQFETFDYKPKLVDMFGKNLPESVRG